MPANPVKETKKIELHNHTKHIARDLAKMFDLSKDQSEEIVSEVLNSMKDIILAEGVLGLKNFGSMKVNHQKNMQYYDFAQRKVCKTSRNVLVFYPSTNVKKLINQIDVASVTKQRQAKKAAAKSDGS